MYVEQVRKEIHPGGARETQVQKGEVVRASLNVRSRRLLVLGEGVDLFPREVPPSLQGKTLADSRIGEQTGLNVVAIERNDTFVTELIGDTPLPSEGHLLLIGSDDQVESFVAAYE